MSLKEIPEYLWADRYELLLITFLCYLFYHRKYLYKEYVKTPLAGGNGKVQMDELARAVLLMMIMLSAEREGRGVEQVYPDIYWTMLFASVIAIAALKVPFSKLSSYYSKKDTSNSNTENL